MDPAFDELAADGMPERRRLALAAEEADRLAQRPGVNRLVVRRSPLAGQLEELDEQLRAQESSGGDPVGVERVEHELLLVRTLGLDLRFWAHSAHVARERAGCRARQHCLVTAASLPLSALVSKLLVAYTIEFDNTFERRMRDDGHAGFISHA